MIQEDTIKLLRECDAGIQMGLSAFEEVMDKVRSNELKKCLTQSREEHEKIKAEVQSRLIQFHDEGKAPNPIVQGMSWIKTSAKLIIDDSDKTIANLITDGCNMGIKSLNRYLNQYKAAEEYVKDITKKLVALEEGLVYQLRVFL